MSTGLGVRDKSPCQSLVRTSTQGVSLHLFELQFSGLLQMGTKAPTMMPYQGCHEGHMIDCNE